LATNADPHTKVFTDGSQIAPEKTGYRYAVFRGRNDLIHTGCRPLPNAEVFEAEIEGALAGLKSALSFRKLETTTGVTVCLDNTSAISCFNGAPTKSSQAAVL
jgi:hypothetical protein